MTTGHPAEPETPAAARTRPVRVLVTAGPTHEPIDAVRFIGNRSSGRMGMALAAAAAARGLAVTLLLGPVGTIAPLDSRITVHRFRTAADLSALLHRMWPGHDLLLMAAAVADFRPVGGADEGKRSRGSHFTLALEPTEDILQSIGESGHPGMIVGFALETASELRRAAARKLASKRCAAIVANALETMESPEIDGILIHADGTEEVPGHSGRSGHRAMLPKEIFADWLIERLLARIDGVITPAPGSGPHRPEA